MQLFSITSNDKHLLFEELIKKIRARPTNETLILVSNQLMVRHLRVHLQNKLTGFAPRIVPLESWLEELSISGLNPQNRPAHILDPVDERPLFLENWIRSHDDTRIKKFTGTQSVKIISDIIGDLHRARLPLNQLLAEIKKQGSTNNSDFGYLLEQYGNKLQSLNWIDREQLPALNFHPLPFLLRESQIIIYETGFLFESQKDGLERIFSGIKLSDQHEISSFQYEPDEAGTGVTPNAWFQDKSISMGFPFTNKFLHIETHPDIITTKLSENEQLSEDELHSLDSDAFHIDIKHNPRAELTEALRLIKWSISHKKPGESGSKFSDYIILAGNLQQYQPYAEALSAKFEVPVYVTRGPARSSHPIIRRFSLLLSLGLNDFQIDDIYQIFADNQFKLPQLEDDDENATPNIRSFCHFCRIYNLRTLQEATERIEDISSRELHRISTDKAFDNEESRKQAISKVEKNISYYLDVIRVLEHFRKSYPTGVNPLSSWVKWGQELIDRQNNLGSSTANQARQDLLILLQNILDTHERLHISRQLSTDEFVEIVKVALESDRESPEDNPGAVLISDATYFGETQDTTTFLLGLNEGSFPRPVKNDFLHFRYQQELNLLFRDRNPDPFLEARYHLQRQLDNAESLYISRPMTLGNGKTIGSSLWQDLLYIMNLYESSIPDDWRWPVIPLNVTLSVFENNLFIGESVSSAVSQMWNQPSKEPAKLVAAIEWERQHSEKMGMYDGTLTDTGNPDWDILSKRNVDDWWQRKIYQGYFPSSISKLDEYSGSPIDYFFNRVLRLEPIARYRDDAESDVKGIILHQILQDFYTADSAYAQNHTKLVDPVHDSFDLARARMDEITEQIFNEYDDRLGHPDSPFPASLRNNMKRILSGFLKYEKNRLELFEYEIAQRFKPASFFENSGFSMEYYWEFDIDIPDIPVPLRLKGFIDRIDWDPETQRAIVFDYKSGGYSIKNFKNETSQGLSFQLPVYGLALIKNGVKSFVGAYYYLPIEGAQSQISLKQFFGDIDLLNQEKIYWRGKKKSDFKGLLDTSEVRNFLEIIIRENVTNMLHLMHRGTFHLPLNGEKKYSDYKIISRYQSLVQEERLRLEKSRDTNSGLSRYYYPKEILSVD